MIVTNGVVWLNSKDIKIVGALIDSTVQVYVKDINGIVNLSYPNKEMACAVRIMLILGLNNNDLELEKTYNYLIEQAKNDGFNIESVIKHVKQFIGDKHE